MPRQDHPPLDERDLSPDPLLQLQSWLDQARAAGQIEPTAMNLATVGADGTPRARMVLFKGFLDGGLSFFTDYEGAKGQEIAARPEVALTFWWDRQERQVRVEGSARRVSREASQRYFASRPRASQLSAFTSHQSRVLASRAGLEERLSRHTDELEGRDVPLPDRWGGFVVEPVLFEFWQGRLGRLHDRLRYRLQDGNWTIDRLEP